MPIFDQVHVLMRCHSLYLEYQLLKISQIWNNVFGGHCCKLPSIRVFFGMKKAVKSEIDLGISLMVRDHVYKFQMIWLREI
jgi:hypothetical protein